MRCRANFNGNHAHKSGSIAVEREITYDVNDSPSFPVPENGSDTVLITMAIVYVFGLGTAAQLTYKHFIQKKLPVEQEPRPCFGTAVISLETISSEQRKICKGTNRTLYGEYAFDAPPVYDAHNTDNPITPPHGLPAEPPSYTTAVSDELPQIESQLKPL
ncbi:hypothetical protein BX616_003953 [Lobosporangium transversale]|nr:hypothetical protein BX616_003953 [Lobosporangium transversale]